MTGPDPDALVPFARAAAALVREKTADAHAHVEKALTDALKDMPDGRPTRARAARSPSYNAALSRLAELREALTDLVREARAAFYRDSFAALAPQIPAALLVSPDPEPTQRNVARIVAALIHGTELRQDLALPVSRASQRLLPALTLAGRSDETGRTATDRLKAWRVQAESTIGSTVRIALSDSQVHAWQEAGRDLIHPDFLED